MTIAGAAAAKAGSIGASLVSELGDVMEAVIKALTEPAYTVTWHKVKGKGDKAITTDHKVEVRPIYPVLAWAAWRAREVFTPDEKGELAQYAVFGPVTGGVIDLINDNLRPPDVPPIPPDAEYNPWWGTHTRG